MDLAERIKEAIQSAEVGSQQMEYTHATAEIDRLDNLLRIAIAAARASELLREAQEGRGFYCAEHKHLRLRAEVAALLDEVGA